MATLINLAGQATHIILRACFQPELSFRMSTLHRDRNKEALSYRLILRRRKATPFSGIRKLSRRLACASCPSSAPDITGQAMGLRTIYGDTATNWAEGSLSLKSGGANKNTFTEGPGLGLARRDLSFSACSSSSTYGSASTVQPKAMRLLALIKL